MLQRNEKGTQARLYFIDCEKRLKELDKTYLTHAEFHVALSKIESNFLKAESYFEEVDERIAQNTARLDELTRQYMETHKILSTQLERVDDMEKHLKQVRERLGIDADCFVYVFVSPPLKLYKIGWADDTQIRQMKLKTGNPKLDFVMAIPMASRVEAKMWEKTLHEHFREQRREGEWFDLSEADLLYINSVRLLQQSCLEMTKNG
jgi:hypothetical protein